MSKDLVPAHRRSDTTAEAARIHFEALRRLGIEQRASMTFELSDSLQRVTETGVRYRHPEYEDELVRLAVVRLWLGSELFRRVHPEVEIDP